MYQTLQLSDYNIYVGDFWAQYQAFLAEKKYSKIIFLTDANTLQCCFEPNKTKFAPPLSNTEILTIAAGEQHKNIETCQKIWQDLFAAEADRQSLLVNIGGGVIGDMGGFCAATFKRGFDFVQVPTTLLSQVDASIGGKLGIDFGQVKNSIGVFGNPKAVFISAEFLETLSKREVRSGFAEIIKHALIADATQWTEIVQVTDTENIDWTKYLVPSLKIKQAVVEADPFEKGLRKALNFGHTIGHAVESSALETDNPLTHGEAIAIGMICETYLSKHILGLSDADLQQITAFLIKIYGKYDISSFDTEHLISLMRQDKKNRSAAEINFALIPQIGSVKVNQTAPPSVIAESLAFYKAIHN